MTPLFCAQTFLIVVQEQQLEMETAQRQQLALLMRHISCTCDEILSRSLPSAFCEQFMLDYLAFRFRVFFQWRSSFSLLSVWLHCVRKKHIFQREFFVQNAAAFVWEQGWPTAKFITNGISSEAQFTLAFRNLQSSARRKSCLNQRRISRWRRGEEYPLACEIARINSLLIFPFRCLSGLRRAVVL